MTDDAEADDGPSEDEGAEEDEEVPGEQPSVSPKALEEEQEEERIEVLHTLLSAVGGSALFWFLGWPFYFGAILGIAAYLIVWYYVMP